MQCQNSNLILPIFELDSKITIKYSFSESRIYSKNFVCGRNTSRTGHQSIKRHECNSQKYNSNTNTFLSCLLLIVLLLYSAAPERKWWFIMTKLSYIATRLISFLSWVYSISISVFNWYCMICTWFMFSMYLSAACLWVTCHDLAGCLAYKALTCHSNHDWKWRHFPCHESGFPSIIHHHVALVSRCSLNPHLDDTIFQISFLLQPVIREKCWIYQGQLTYKGNWTWRHEVFKKKKSLWSLCVLF